MIQAIERPSSAQLPPLDHPLADIIYRLEAGGALIPDTPVNWHVQSLLHSDGLLLARFALPW